MRHLFLTIVAVIAIIFTGNVLAGNTNLYAGIFAKDTQTSSHEETPVLRLPTKEIENPDCGKLMITADRNRIEVVRVMIDFLAKKYGEIPVEFIEYPSTVSYKGKILKGFYVNNVGVPYSDVLLKKSEKLLGFDASYSQREQEIELEKLICSSQLKLLENEYFRTLRNIRECEKNEVVIPISLDLVVVDTDKGNWWSAPWTWFLNLLEWLVFGLLLLLILYLLWRLLQWIIDSTKNRDKSINPTSKAIMTHCECGKCSHNADCDQKMCCCYLIRREEEITKRWEIAAEAGKSGKVEIEFQTDEKNFRAKFTREELLTPTQKVPRKRQ